MYLRLQNERFQRKKQWPYHGEAGIQEASKDLNKKIILLRKKEGNKECRNEKKGNKNDISKQRGLKEMQNYLLLC